MRRISRILAATFALSLSTLAMTQASQVALSVAMSNPVLKSDQKQTAFLKVGLEGFRMPVTSKRVAVNVALVLDKSGSMNGRKIEEAKQAAIQAIRRLDANDIVSVVVYDSTVEVLVPATKLTDKNSVCKKIAQIHPGGRTALFARIRAVTRRCHIARGADLTASFKMDDLEIFPAELRASRGEQTIELSLRDVQILEFLHRNAGRVLDRNTIFNHAWGEDYFPNSRTLDQHISQLRKRIEVDPKSPRIIRTVHGAGYRYEHNDV